MSGKQKQTPLEKASAEFQALFDSMLEAAGPELDRSREAMERATDCAKRGDWQGFDLEMNSHDAHQSAAIAASAKVKPTVKRASAAGKLSGEARRMKSAHGEIQRKYLSLIAKGLNHPKARRQLFREYLRKLSISQIDRVIAPLKK